MRAPLAAGLCSTVSAPLISNDSVVGVLTLWSTSANAFEEHHLALIRRVASELARRVAPALAEEQVHRAAIENEALLEIGQVIASSLDLDEIYDRFAQHVRKIIDFDLISVTLADPQEGILTLPYASPASETQVPVGWTGPLDGSVTQEVVSTASPLMIELTSADELTKSFPALLRPFKDGFRSLISAPLVSRGLPFGVLHLSSRRSRSYSQSHLDLLSRVAAQIAGAVANSRLHAASDEGEREQRRLAHQHGVMAEIGRIIGSSLNIEEVYERFAQEVRKLIPLDRITINVIDEENDEFRIVYTAGLHVPGAETGDALPMQGSPTARVVDSRSGVLLNLDDIIKAGGASAAVAMFKPGIRSVLRVPLVTRGAAFGTLSICSTQSDLYDDRHLLLAEQVGTQIAGAVASSQFYHQLEKEAKEREVLAEIGRIISSSLDINEVYERFAEQVRSLLPADRISVSLVDEEAGTVSIPYQEGTDVGNALGGPVSGSLTEEVMRTRSPVLLRAEDTDSLLERFPRLRPDVSAGLRSFITVPLVARDRVIGALHIRATKPDAFAQRDLELGERIGAQIAGAVANSELHASLEREAREREVLAEIGRIIGSSLDIDEVYERFSAQVRRLIPFDRTTIITVDLEGGTLTDAYQQGIDVPGRLRGTVTPLPGTQTEEVIRKRSAVLIQTEDRDELATRFPGLLLAFDAGLRCFLAVPLISRDLEIGMLQLQSSKPDAYGEADVVLAEQVASQIAGAVANSQLYAERLRIEESLRESERQYRSLYDHTPVMMHAIDHEGRLINVNQRWLDTLGYERSEVIGRRSTDFLTDASRRYAIEVTLPEFWRTGSAADVEYQMVKRNGEVIDVLLSAVAERDESGEEVTQSLAFLVDVTERKRADEALAYQARLVENVSDAIIASDERFVTTAWNRAAEEMYGWTAQEVIGRPTAEFLQPEFVDVEPDEVFRRLREEGRFEGEVIQPRKDGTRIHTEARAMALRDQDGQITGFVSIDRDITERKQLEARFLQAQKMEAFGQLAGGVAHDFNNLLTAIINFTYLATKSVPQEGAASDYLDEVQGAAERAGRLTSQLLAFSRRQVIQPRVLALNDVIMDTTRMLRRLIGEHIELVTLMESELGSVKVDPGHIEQVLTNLAVNARDAMPEGGKLVIETANVSLDEEFARWHPEATPGEYVLLSVSDNGVGMTEEVQKHAFEPLFTTKEVGKGTGLGLSTCYGIVAQSGGHIEIQSEPGQGTVIRIWLPLVVETFDTLPLRDESGYLPTGSETVLVVEDEPLVQHVAAEILRAQGYEVLEAANGTEAMQVAAAHAGEPIHLLLTDVVMPLMGGAQLAQQFTKVHPETRALYMSGYVDDTMVHQQVLQNYGAFLQKPFTPQMLARRVRETLDRDLTRV